MAWRATSGRAHRLEEVVELGRQLLRLILQRPGRAHELAGGAAGVGGRVLHGGHVGRDLLGADRGLPHVAGNLARGGRLLLHGLGDRGRDGIDLVDGLGDRADRLDGVAGRLLHVLDLARDLRSEEHTSELQSLRHLVCRLLLEKKKTKYRKTSMTANTSTTTSSHVY